jgi:type I restriction enzyme, S subunit
MTDKAVLGDYVTFQYGKLPPKETHPDAKYPIFTGYRISGYSKIYLFEEPEVIVVARGVGGTGDVKLSPPLAYVTNLSIVLQPIQPINKRYLRDYLSLANLRQLDSGAAQSMITIESLRRFPVVLPPLAIQDRIAETIARYDDLIETNRRRIALLEETSRLLYREWFVHLRFPGHAALRTESGTPDDWKMGAICDLALFLNRGITPTYDDAASGLVINQKCIRGGRLNLTPARRQSKAVKPERQIQVGDVLINSTGAGTLGRVAQVRTPIPDCTVDTHVTIVRPSDSESAAFLGVALLELESVLSTMGIGSTNQLELGRADIAALSIFIPPLAMREEFQELVWPLFMQAETLAQTNERLTEARDALLPKLMSGEIQV